MIKVIKVVKVTKVIKVGKSNKSGKSDKSGTHPCEICDPKCKYDNCICNKNWKIFDETLQETIKNISSNILLESLRISTITLCFNLNSNVNVEQLIIKVSSAKNNGKFYNSYIFNWHTKYQSKKNCVS